MGYGTRPIPIHYYIWGKKFAENCMKMKEIGPRAPSWIRNCSYSNWIKRNSYFFILDFVDYPSVLRRSDIYGFLQVSKFLKVFQLLFGHRYSVGVLQTTTIAACSVWDAWRGCRAPPSAPGSSWWCPSPRAPAPSLSAATRAGISSSRTRTCEYKHSKAIAAKYPENEDS